MYYIIKYKTHDNMSSCQKVIVFAKFPKKGIAFGGGHCYPWFCKKRTGKGTDKERKGSICGLGLLFEQMGIARVALGVSLISPLACTQLCAKQLEMWTLCTIICIAFGGHIATQCLEHFPDTRELSFTKVVYQSFDRTSYDIIILYI